MKFDANGIYELAPTCENNPSDIFNIYPGFVTVDEGIFMHVLDELESITTDSI